MSINKKLCNFYFLNPSSIALLLSALIASLTAFTQPQNIYNFPIDSSTGKISFSDVMEKQGITKELIYSRTKVWIAQTFNSAKDVINMDDKESGIIKLKGNYAENKTAEKLTYVQTTAFDMFIYIKEGRYKYQITNLTQKIDIGGGDFNPLEVALMLDPKNKDQMQYYEYRKKWSEEVKTHIAQLAESLNKAVSNKSAAEF